MALLTPRRPPAAIVVVLFAAGCTLMLHDDYRIVDGANRSTGATGQGGSLPDESTALTGGVAGEPAQFEGDAAVGDTCADGRWDGTETDVDCGGTCVPCGDGKHCLVGTDCTSLVCKDDLCAKPICDDGVLNGTETDVDCGGSCPHCLPGMMCNVDTDCESDVCLSGICGTQCQNGKRDGHETDVDCGGPDCPGCPAGKICSISTDCLSGICINHLCA